MNNNNISVTKTSTGAAMIETIIVFPLLMFVGLGIVHLGLIYQAKSNLEYASFMAARQAAATSLGSSPDDLDNDTYNGLDELKRTIRCRMVAFDPLPGGVVCQDADLPLDELNKVQIQFIRPTLNAFISWGETAPGVACAGYVDGCQISNTNLLAQDPTDLVNGINIQTANIATISVRYLVDTGVPFMNTYFLGEIGADGDVSENMEDLNPDVFVDDPFNLQRNRPGVWITAESTMHMQTNPTISTVNLCAFGAYC